MPMEANSNRIYFTDSNGRLVFDTNAKMAHITNASVGHVLTPSEVPFEISAYWGGGGGENDSWQYTYYTNYVHTIPLFNIDVGDANAPESMMYSFVSISGGDADTGGKSMSMIGGSIIARVFRLSQYPFGMMLLDIEEDLTLGQVVLRVRTSFSSPGVPEGYSFSGNNTLQGLSVGVSYRIYRGKYR